MKDIIIQKIKGAIVSLTDESANVFLTTNLPKEPTLEDYQNLLSKVQSGEIEVN